MPQSYSTVWIHILFATKNRKPLITAARASIITKTCIQTCDELNSIILSLNNTANHIHILCSLPRETSIAQLLQLIKGRSAYRINNGNNEFEWQRGYATFSVSDKELSPLSSEIEQQALVHQNITYDPKYDLKLVDHPYFDPVL